MELGLSRRLSEFCKRHIGLANPVLILIIAQTSQVNWERCWMRDMVRFEGHAFFYRHVTLRNGANHFLSAILGERDVNYGGLTTKLGVSDREKSISYLSAAEKIQVEGYAIWLVLRG